MICTRRVISAWSRRVLITPPSHRRVETISAIAIQTIPHWVLTPTSSAWTWPRSRGCTTCWWWESFSMMAGGNEPVADGLRHHTKGMFDGNERTAPTDERDDQ